MVRRLTLLGLAALVGLSFVTTTVAQEREMTMQEYEMRLAACRARQRAADSTRAAAEQRLSEVQGEIAQVEGQIVEINQSVMREVASDSSARQDSLAKLNAIQQQLRALQQLSANQIVDAREAGELDRLVAQLDALKGSRLAALPEFAQQIEACENLIASLRAVERPVPPVRRDQYTVVRGDNLWNISKRPNIYGDAFAWVRIYSANKDMIRDPNLIYPEWVIGVPRGGAAAGTYWVNPGDNLHDIAGKREVYGDPTQWTRLYSANRDVIETLGGDERTIYPYMILQVPQQ